jgi:thioester reductase-like protein
MKNKYLVCGAGGFIGGHLVQSLLNDELAYTDFSIYLLKNKNKEVFGIETIKRLSKVFDNLYKSCENKEFNKLFLPHWDKNSNFMFIPEYQEDGKISSLT